MRPLGILPVAERIAQVVGKRYLEPQGDKRFYPDSYGYRLGNSGIEGVGRVPDRCWR